MQSSGPRGIFQIARRVRPTGIVRHDAANFFLPDHKAAEILCEFNRLLKYYAQVARLVECAKELVAATHFVHIAPTVAIDGLQKTGALRQRQTQNPRSRGNSRLRIDFSEVPLGSSLCGSNTVGGTATPRLRASA